METNIYKDKIKKSKVKSIAKALCIIDILSKSNTELSLKEISTELEIPITTTYGILSTLKRFNYIEHMDNSKYALNIYLFELGNEARNKWDVHKLAIPYMNKISNKFNETANLVILNENRILFIDKKKASYEYEIGTHIGARLPAHSSAAGKVLLAYQTEDEVDNIIDKEGLYKCTKNTITSRKSLKKELKKIRTQGYAIDKEELIENIICVAAPIINHKNKCIAALSIAGLASRLRNKNLEEIGEYIKEQLLELSRKIGYKDK